MVSADWKCILERKGIASHYSFSFLPDGMMRGGDDNSDSLDAYCYFCYNFGPVLVGSSKWKLIMTQNTTFSKQASSSDIAFGLVALQNSVPRWDWEYGKSSDEIKALEEGKDPGVVKPLYTTGRGRFAKKDRGWSEEGIDRYNELLGLVKQGRINDDRGSFDAYFKQYIQRMNGTAGEIERNGTESNACVEADLDFD
jgi:hypothetical protein